MKTLALFDFDGTITTKDTFLEFIKYYKGVFNFYLGFFLLSPLAILYFLGIIPNWKFKVIVLKYFFKDEDASLFDSKCEDFCKEIVPNLIRPEALKEIANQKKIGDLYIVSASADWIKPWCKTQNIPCICTVLERDHHKITGDLDGKNCYGVEKTTRIKKEVNLSDYTEIIAYGDSAGDKEMFEIATHFHYKPFR